MKIGRYPKEGTNALDFGSALLVEGLGSLEIQTTELDSIGRFKASALVLLHRNEDFRLLAPASID